jgi:hypothetical protein
MSFVVLEKEELYGEFETAEEVEEDLKENFDGDVEDLRVFEIDTEDQVKKSFDLEEID